MKLQELLDIKRLDWLRDNRFVSMQEVSVNMCVVRPHAQVAIANLTRNGSKVL